MARPKKRTPKKGRKAGRRAVSSADWAPAFLAHLRGSANVRASCATAGVARSVAYARKDEDEEFAAAWSDAVADAIDDLEAVAFERAKDSSDTLVIFLLKSHRRAVYGDRQEIKVEGTLSVTEVVVKTRAQADAVLAMNPPR